MGKQIVGCRPIDGFILTGQWQVEPGHGFEKSSVRATAGSNNQPHYGADRPLRRGFEGDFSFQGNDFNVYGVIGGEMLEAFDNVDQLHREWAMRSLSLQERAMGALMKFKFSPSRQLGGDIIKQIKGTAIQTQVKNHLRAVRRCKNVLN